MTDYLIIFSTHLITICTGFWLGFCRRTGRSPVGPLWGPRIIIDTEELIPEKQLEQF